MRVFDNFSTGKRENIEEFTKKENFELFEGDLRRINDIKKAIKDIDYVLHQAAVPSVQRSVENPMISNDSNIKGTLNLLIAARDKGVKKVVYASSSSIYGDSPELPKKEDMPPNPVSPYALTKYTGEKYCQLFSNLYGLPTICLRYFNVFGPKQDPNSQYAAVIPKFTNAILNGEHPIIYGDGKQSRDFTYVANVVQANLLACESDSVEGKLFNVACGERHTLLDLVAELNKILNKEIKPTFIESRKGDVRHSMADISKIRGYLDYHPIYSFREGLEKTVEWYRS